MRLFIAVDLPEELKREIAAAFAGRARASCPGSWVNPASLHVTLAFPGDQKETLLPVLAASLRKAAAGLQPFEVKIGGAGYFPDRRRARVGWLGMESGGTLETLASAVRRQLTEASVEFDRKPFSPHLTLVRIRGRWSDEELDHFGALAAPLSGKGFRVERVRLYESLLRPEGAAHHPRAEVVLGV